MRIYFIYLIKDEFAEYFYGHEIKFFNLFSVKHHKAEHSNSIIERQIDYITEPLPFLELHRHLLNYVQSKEIHIKGKVYYSMAEGSKDGAELTIEENCIQLKAWGGVEAESVFFEVLRKFEGSFFAIDHENEEYGWIKPVKERKYI